jgi:putative endopeptidase
VERADSMIGDVLGKAYVDKVFPPAAKARMQEMVKFLLAAMQDSIRGLDWMTDETRQKALAKLAAFRSKVGSPDRWKTYEGLTIARGRYFDNVLRSTQLAERVSRARIGKQADPLNFGMTTPTSNAYYSPLGNEIVFPAGIMVPPFFSLDADDVVNYGAIGVVIGHEISHGFDDEGSQYDAQGRLANWWSDEDLKRFRERGQCVVDQFEGYFIEPGIHHNGKLVLGESIGDLAGAKIAYLAFKKSLEGRPAPGPIDSFTPEQQFFIAWGQFRGDEIRPETQRLMVQTDPHPTGKYRVIGPLSNMPEFQQAFGCAPTAAMVRPAAERCEVW